MHQYFIPYFMMRINEQTEKFGIFPLLLFILFSFLFEHFEVMNTSIKLFKSVLNRSFKHNISLYGIKHYDKYGYKNQKYSIHATPGFIALNTFLIQNLREGNLKGLDNISEIVYSNCEMDDIEDSLCFQIKSDSMVSLEKNKEWENIYFTLREEKIEKNEKNNGLEEATRIELRIMSNVFNVKNLMRRCDLLHEEYENKKQGRSLEKLFIFNYHGDKKGKDKNLYDISTFSSNCSLDNLFFEEKDKIMSYIHFFQNNKDWYRKRGRPYTLGLCSYGPPGCGKTSFEKALAIYLNRHLIVVDFDKIRSEEDLLSIFYDQKIGPFKIPNERRLYIFPDIDKTTDILYKEEYKTNIYEKSLMYKKIIHSIQQKKKIEQDENDNDDSVNTVSTEGINLSQILNIIDGIMERTGQIFIMSANHPEKLDDAIVRPGRIDCMINFKEFTTELLEIFINNFFNKVPKDMITFIHDNKEKLNYKFTPSKLFEVCVQSKNNFEDLKNLLLL